MKNIITITSVTSTTYHVYTCKESHSHNNSSVVSGIKPSLYPPNKTTTLKSGPVPNTTAECPSRPVMLVGRDTCRKMGKQVNMLLLVKDFAGQLGALTLSTLYS